MSGFQTSVQQNQSYGIPGDFATTAPWGTVPAGPGELTAGAAGVVIAQWAWADDTTGVVSSSKPSLTSTRMGFVGRDQRSLITTYLAESSFVVPYGMEVTLYDSGSYFITAPSGGATIGQKVFANYATGASVLGTAGSPPTTAITGNTTSGAATLANLSAPVSVGQLVSGAGIPAGTVILTGAAAGGTATMSTNATATATAVAVTLTTAYETRFYVKTQGVAGDVVIISSTGL